MKRMEDEYDYLLTNKTFRGLPAVAILTPILKPRCIRILFRLLYSLAVCRGYLQAILLAHRVQPRRSLGAESLELLSRQLRLPRIRARRAHIMIIIITVFRTGLSCYHA
jgi:hypothetical protein